ncbi:TolC family protein [Marinilabilia salmonicolor]|jgi:outer membrane protein TolC|uniref:Outer membrane protein TolC n=1 Tax=Marinilabilia salmonicolor TaxID=989 RepID=A0A2T0XAD5_9BACT|nr:TolC family protein [Marinilabilia salmonicolor]PRY95877.1 outer membrane protein TolC [Marinilabilia salmonicolor]RCW28896.1 outer membrane protein TolC [Marinilabilia salmonicolor]
MRFIFSISTIFLFGLGTLVSAQEQEYFVEAVPEDAVVLPMALDDVIDLAHEQSLYSFRSKNMYLARYWEFRSYKADRLPILSLEATPVDYDRSVVNRFDSETGTEYFSQRSYFTSDASLSLRQNVPFTGGVFDVTSSLSRSQNLDDEDDIQYASVPVSVGFSQPLNGYNRFRWESRIEPLKFEKAKRDYLQSLEGLAIQATDYFFGQVTAEINLKIAETNYSNADTLYNIGKGRFEIGTVTQDELLDLELSLLNASMEVTRAKVNLRQSRAELSSFLGLEDNVVIECEIPDEIPELKIDPEKAMTLAIENNPDILDFQQRMLEAEQSIARARSESGLNANVRANFGINKNADEVGVAYGSPFADQQQLRVSLSIPLLDWGLRKGQIQMARSNRDVTEATVKQERIDFEQELFIQIMEFNMQEKQVEISAKADTIAQRGYDVTKQRFLIDKVDVIKLNSARNSLDAARRNYISSLRQYWRSYYQMRQYTLYDFVDNQPLMQELDYLLQQ